MKYNLLLNVFLAMLNIVMYFGAHLNINLYACLFNLFILTILIFRLNCDLLEESRTNHD